MIVFCISLTNYIFFFEYIFTGGYFVKLESELLSKIDQKNVQKSCTVDAKGQAKIKPKKTIKSNF